MSPFAPAIGVLTKVLTPILALLRQRVIAIVGYLDDLLRASGSELEENVSIASQTLREFGWVLNIQKSFSVPTQRLEYLGLIQDSLEAKVFLSLEKFQRPGNTPTGRELASWAFWGNYTKNVRYLHSRGRA